MHTEIDVHNKKGQLFAGMYADVTLILEHENSVLAVPIQAVTRNGDQASVMVVNPEDRIEERQVKLGLEGTNDVEVISGLSANEKVIVGSRGEFRNGDLVQPRLVAQNQEEKF